MSENGNISVSYRASHKKKGEDYHLVLSSNRLHSALWEIEKRSLAKAINDYFHGEVDSYLDFACGTGRVIRSVRQFANYVVGVDVSPSMLEQASKESPDIKFIEADLTKDNELDGQKFDLITAFRFFPNAEPELRSEVMQTLTKLIKPDGLIIFNNHLNSTSLRRIVFWHIKKRLFGNIFGKGYGHSMSRSEVEELIKSHGLEIVDIFPIGHLPMTEKIHIVPTKLMYLVELFFSKYIKSERFSQNIIYVCKPVSGS